MVTAKRTKIRAGISRRRIHAREMRRVPTDSERKLWYALRDRRLGGHKFKRQVPIGPYIADFVCIESRLIVELDGGQHAERAAYDAKRTGYLAKAGYRVLRFWNVAFLSNRDAVLDEILRALEHASPPPSP